VNFWRFVGIVFRGVTRGTKGAQFPGRRMTAGSAEKSQQCTFFNTVHLLRKDFRFEHGFAKLASCPGRHLTLLGPWRLLLPSCEISARSPRLAKWAVANFGGKAELLFPAISARMWFDWRTRHNAFRQPGLRTFRLRSHSTVASQ